VYGSGQGANCARDPFFASISKPHQNAAHFVKSPRWHGRARNLPWSSRERRLNVAQRIVELLIGRLITDEQFREEFLRDPGGVLSALVDRGLELSRTEAAALLNTDQSIWARTADAIDPRLQKVNLKPAGDAPAQENVNV
jgi:hypothetical protein